MSQQATPANVMSPTSFDSCFVEFLDTKRIICSCMYIDSYVIMYYVAQQLTS